MSEQRIRFIWPAPEADQENQMDYVNITTVPLVGDHVELFDTGAKVPSIYRVTQRIHVPGENTIIIKVVSS